MSTACRRWSYPFLLSSALAVILLGCKSQNSNDIEQSISQTPLPEPLNNPVKAAGGDGYTGSLPTISNVIATGSADDKSALISAAAPVSLAPVVMEHSLPLLNKDDHATSNAMSPRVTVKSIKVTVKNTQTVSIKSLAMSDHHRYGRKAVDFSAIRKGSGEPFSSARATNTNSEAANVAAVLDLSRMADNQAGEGLSKGFRNSGLQVKGCEEGPLMGDAAMCQQLSLLDTGAHTGMWPSGAQFTAAGVNVITQPYDS